MNASPHRFQEHREVALPKAAVWDVLCHTDRINRHIGLPPVIYGEVQLNLSGVYRPASARMLGVALSWREYPFSWEAEGHYSVVRVYERGPIARFEGGVELEEVGPNRTRITFFADVDARGALGWAFVPVLARQSLQKTLALAHRLLESPDAPIFIEAPPPRRWSVDEALLLRLSAQLERRSVAASSVAALVELLRSGGDDEVSDLRPFAWARRVKVDRTEALRVCLHAVKVGLLNQKWALMCPNCRVSKGQVSTLSEVEAQVHCDLCGIDYRLGFDRYVELRFSVAPAVRRASSAVYCISGPFRAPHILLQRQLLPGQSVLIPRLLRDEAMRLRALKWNQNVAIEPEGEAGEAVEWNGKSWSHEAAHAPFQAHNASDEPIVVALERIEWDADAVTAAQVTAMQEFRDLFSGEVLSPGREMGVENITVFFSDLSNSTALYERVGDARAFARVGRHFDVLQDTVAREGGAVVKTMGDAVMAVFPTPVEGVRAALSLQERFAEFARDEAEAGLALKIGLHCGPALAVTSNERLDYFGRTVNIAARVSSLAQGGELVFTSSLWQLPAVRVLVCQTEARVARFKAPLRGVDEEFDLVRVQFETNVGSTSLIPSAR